MSIYNFYHILYKYLIKLLLVANWFSSWNILYFTEDFEDHFVCNVLVSLAQNLFNKYLKQDDMVLPWFVHGHSIKWVFGCISFLLLL